MTPDAALPLESVPATCACLAGTCSPTKKACDTQGRTPPLASLAERTYDDTYIVSDPANRVNSSLAPSTCDSCVMLVPYSPGQNRVVRSSEEARPNATRATPDGQHPRTQRHQDGLGVSVGRQRSSWAFSLGPVSPGYPEALPPGALPVVRGEDGFSGTEKLGSDGAVRRAGRARRGSPRA